MRRPPSRASARHGRPAHREAGVERERGASGRPPRPGPGARRRHPGVEEHEGIPRAQAQAAPGDGEPLLAGAGPGQHPAEHVIAHHAGRASRAARAAATSAAPGGRSPPRSARGRGRSGRRSRRAAPAWRGRARGSRARPRAGPGRARSPPGRRGTRGAAAGRSPPSSGSAAASSRPCAARTFAIPAVARGSPGRSASAERIWPGPARVAAAEAQQPELHAGPGARLAPGPPGVDGEPHQGDRGVAVATQLGDV